MCKPSYEMENDFDCGPAAMAFALGKDVRSLKKFWGWRDFDNSKDNLLDSPYHHFNMLSRMLCEHLTVDANDIIAHRCPNNKTVILLHFVKDEEDKCYLAFLKEQIYATLNQHWVVLHSVVNEHVIVHWGDGQLRAFPAKVFKKWYTAGFPNCAYLVGRGRTSVPWYVRIYARVTGKFASCL